MTMAFYEKYSSFIEPLSRAGLRQVKKARPRRASIFSGYSGAGFRPSIDIWVIPIGISYNMHVYGLLEHNMIHILVRH